MRRTANENVNNPSPEERAAIEMRIAEIKREGLAHASPRRRKGTYEMNRVGKNHLCSIKKRTPE